MASTDDFNWGDRGEQFWRDLAKEARVGNERILRFFVSTKDRGCSPSQAAREGGVPGDPAKQGYRLARSLGFEKLNEKWILKLGGDPAGPVTRAEVRAEIAKMIRYGDPQSQKAGIELQMKLDAQEREQGTSRQDDGFGIWRFMRDACLDGPGAVAGMVLMYPNVTNLPMLHDIFPRMQLHWPEIWDKLAARQNAAGKQALERQLADPEYQLPTRRQLWAEKNYAINVDGSVSFNPARVNSDTVAEPTAGDSENISA